MIEQLEHSTEVLMRKVEAWQACSLANQPGLAPLAPAG